MHMRWVFKVLGVATLGILIVASASALMPPARTTSNAAFLILAGDAAAGNQPWAASNLASATFGLPAKRIIRPVPADATWFGDFMAGRGAAQTAIDKAGADGLLDWVVYFNGACHVAGDGTLFLLPDGVGPGNARTKGVSLAGLSLRLARLPYESVLLLVETDCSGLRQEGAALLPDPWSKLAMIVADGSAHPGVLTAAVFEGLNGLADKDTAFGDQDGIISFGELQTLVARRMTQNAAATAPVVPLFKGKPGLVLMDVPLPPEPREAPEDVVEAEERRDSLGSSGGGVLNMFSMQSASPSGTARSRVHPMPSMVPPPPPSGPPILDRENYRDVDANPVKVVREDPVSTFSIDVDTASYANVRRFLDQGRMPPKGAIRIEEMINYFDYSYPLPERQTAPFAPSVTIVPTPWNPETKLLHIGIQGYDEVSVSRPDLNLVFLVDNSGSMNSPDKLPLLQKGLRLLVGQLQDGDSVAMVTYGGGVTVPLEPTDGSERRRILSAIDQLSAGGYTPGAAAIEKAYELASLEFDPDAVNRVILATDGDFNVGITDPDQLEGFIERQRETGIYLTVLGFGTGNLNDALMQRLAQSGNGIAGYVDSLKEARKLLVDEMAANLFPIANDVKIQIEFNPALVGEYRLIGYETRMLRREDFSNDRVDAGEIGNGHQVTAIYEITPPGSAGRRIEPLRYGSPAEQTAQEAAGAGARKSDEYGFLRIRYKLPGERTSKLIERPVTLADEVAEVSAAGQEVQFATAVAAFGQLLRGDPYTETYTYPDVLSLAQPARGPDPYGYRAEFVQLVRMAETLTGR